MTQEIELDLLWDSRLADPTGEYEWRSIWCDSYVRDGATRRKNHGLSTAVYMNTAALADIDLVGKMLAEQRGKWNTRAYEHGCIVGGGEPSLVLPDAPSDWQWNDCRLALKQGSPILGDKIREYNLRLMDLSENWQPTGIERHRMWLDDGDELSYDRLYGGQCDTAWEARKRRIGKLDPTVTVVANFGGNGGRSEEGWFWSGAVGCVLVDKLEAAGYRVELISCEYAVYVTEAAELSALQAKELGFANRNNRNAFHGTFCKVKEPNEDLNTDLIAAVMASGQTFTSQGYRAIGTVHLPEECPPELADRLKGPGHKQENRHRQSSIGSMRCVSAVPDYIAATMQQLGLDRENAILVPDFQSEENALNFLTKSVEGFIA